MYSPTKEIPKLLLVCSAGDPTPTGREFSNQPAKAVAFGAVQQASRDQGKGDGQPDPVRFQTPFFYLAMNQTRFVDYFPICLRKTCQLLFHGPKWLKTLCRHGLHDDFKMSKLFFDSQKTMGETDTLTLEYLPYIYNTFHYYTFTIDSPYI